MDRLQADIAAVARIGAVPTILRVVSEVTGLRLALVARVTRESWIACAVLDRMEFGLGVGDQLDVATTLCSEVRDSHEPIIIEHASAEPEFCEHPTPKMYGLESYIAVPIFRPNGEYFGNVCALDSAPATLRDGKTLGMMKLFAELISLQLAAEEESVRDREALARERETAELREQFIAVLGHDLRNPLSSIMMSAGFLLALPQEPRQKTVLERIQGSGERMSRLIDDILDFARGRLGGGMEIHPERVDVADLVGEVVDEIAGDRPERTVRIAPSGAGTAWLDRSRIAQMLSNLVANAVEHGPAGEPVDISVAGSGGPRRARRQQPRRSHPPGGGRAALRALRPGGAQEAAAGARPWPLHRGRDRARPRRSDPRRVVGGGRDHVHRGAAPLAPSTALNYGVWACPRLRRGRAAAP